MASLRFSEAAGTDLAAGQGLGFDMLTALFVSFLMCTLTMLIHMTGLIVLMAFMRARSGGLRPHENMFGQAGFIMLIVFGLFAIHAVEIWAYALLYLGFGEFDTLESSLYFATSTFTTLGYGDVILGPGWRLVAAIEGFNGFLLIGWSTAFLVSVISRLRTIEFDWLDHHRDAE